MYAFQISCQIVWVSSDWLVVRICEGVRETVDVKFTNMRQNESPHSDEGLNESANVGQFTLLTLWWTIYFSSVSLSHRRNRQLFLMKLNPFTLTVPSPKLIIIHWGIKIEKTNSTTVKYCSTALQRMVAF